MNVLKANKQQDCLALVRAQYSFREIEDRLGIRRETISKYAKAAGLVGNSKPATSSEVATGILAKTGQSDRSGHRMAAQQKSLKFPSRRDRPASRSDSSSSRRSRRKEMRSRFTKTSSSGLPILTSITR